MDEGPEASEISRADIERTARFLIARYGERAESVAQARITAYGELGKIDAAAIWVSIRTEILNLSGSSREGGIGA